MEFNNDFFLMANGYKITDGYNYGDKHHYIVIIFNNFLKEISSYFWNKLRK